MGGGLLVDLWRSPIGAILLPCSDDTLVETLYFHVIFMPYAHVGMFSGALFCAFWRCRRDALGPRFSVLLLAGLLIEMSVVEILSLFLFSPVQSPVLMMVFMGLIMVLIELFPNGFDLFRKFIARPPRLERISSRY